MTEELKQLIATAERAKRVDSGSYKDFLIASMGEAYSGLWAGSEGNGFNNMLVLAGDFIEDKWVMLSQRDCDALNLFGLSYLGVVDVPTKYDCIRLHFESPIKIATIASSICAKPDDSIDAFYAELPELIEKADKEGILPHGNYEL